MKTSVWKMHQEPITCNLTLKIKPCGCSAYVSVGPLKVQTICLESAYICVSFHFYGYWFDAGGKLCLWCVLAPITLSLLVWVDKWKVRKRLAKAKRNESKNPQDEGLWGPNALKAFGWDRSDCLLLKECVLTYKKENAKPRLFDHQDLVTHMISWLWPHKWHLIISTAEKSQDRIEFTLKRRNVLLKTSMLWTDTQINNDDDDKASLPWWENTTSCLELASCCLIFWAWVQRVRTPAQASL